MRQGESSRFTLNTLENGIDFIRSAVEHLRTDADPRELKYGVVHLSSGVEIVLKERLQREHWSLVFEKVDKADMGCLRSGDFVSVGLDQAQDRLSKICGVRFGTECSEKLRQLNKIRNRLMHFAVDEEIGSVRAVAASVISCILDFIAQELGSAELTPEVDADLGVIRTGLSDIEEFVRERWRRIESQREGLTGELICPRCFQAAAYVDDGLTCLFCNYSAPGEEAAREFALSVLGHRYYDTKDGYERPVRTCPSTRLTKSAL